MEKLTLSNPITINGKKVKTLTYDTGAITVGMFAEAEALKLRATTHKAGGSAGRHRARLLHAPLPHYDGDHRRQPRHRHRRPRAHQWARCHGAGEDRPKFYHNEVGGTLRAKRLGELVRDYSRAFHISVGELRRERLTDFLLEYYEAAEEAKKQRAKIPKPRIPHIRPHRRR